MWLATSYKKSAARRKQPSHPTQKTKNTKKKKTNKQTNRKSNRHYNSSCCILATEVSNLCIVYYCKQKLDSQEK
jgi:hypothetical protein